jgi:hypothetical protein
MGELLWILAAVAAFGALSGYAAGGTSRSAAAGAIAMIFALFAAGYWRGHTAVSDPPAPVYSSAPAPTEDCSPTAKPRSFFCP